MKEEYYDYKPMKDRIYYSMPSKDSIQTKLIRECLNTLYKNSIPSITLEELEEKYRKVKEEKGKKEADRLHTYEGYYCPSTIQNQIIDHYLSIYNLEKHWEDECDIILRDLEKGPTIDKYIEGENGFPGYRGYEHLDPLKDKIGEEAYNQVVDYINKIKNFYRFEYKIDGIRAAIWNVAPCTSMEHTIKWQKENGNPDFNITKEEIENKYFWHEEDEDDYYYNDEETKE